MNQRLVTSLLIAAVSAAAMACSHEPNLNVQVAQATTAPPAPAAAAPAGAGAQPLPAGHPPLQATLPANHPPMGQMGQAPAAKFELPPVAPEAGTGTSALSWTAPTTWVSEPPANSMRRAQYRVPGAGGDGECVVFYFGPGQGGDPQSNVQRWASQFMTADGKPGTTAMKTRELEASGMKVLVVEAKGTYMAGSMMGGAVQPKAGQALLGAVVEGPDSNWFFKLTGPEATVEAQRQAFDAMLTSVKKGG